MGLVAEKDENRRFVSESGKAGEIASLAEPVIEDLGFRLVRVVVSGRDGGTVQIMADKAEGGISVDDCAIISRNLSPLLDVHEPLPGGYFLEISSPGIDRPLVRASDFEDWAGFEAKVEVKQMIEGRKRFRGRLEGFEDGEIRMEVELDGYEKPMVMGFALSMVESAKLVMTDELMKAAMQKSNARTKNNQDRIANEI